MSDKPTKTPDTQAFDWIRAETLRCQGRIWESAQYIVVHVPGSNRLVVAFDNLASRRETERRVPFAYDLIRNQGWGCLGVMSKANGFFQSEALHDDLDRIKAEGVFDPYDAVSFYGASAGAFAAAAFAGLSPGATVVAISPQSSLAKKHAPFESRYRYARRLETWDETPDRRYRDAAVGIKTASKAYLIYDPMEPIDAAHIGRLRGPNTVELRAPHFTHKIPPVLKRMNVLKAVALGTLRGDMSEQEFYTLIRARKTAIPHALQVIQNAVDRGHLDLAESAARFAIARQSNWKLRQLLRTIRALKQQERGQADT